MINTKLDGQSRRWLLGLACGISLCASAGAAPFDTWFPVNSGTTRNLFAVTWTDRIVVNGTLSGAGFVAVGLGGAILTSPDGLIWTDHTLDTNHSYHAVASIGNTVVAVGHNNVIVASKSRGVAGTWFQVQGNNSFGRLTGVTPYKPSLWNFDSDFLAVGDAFPYAWSADPATLIWVPVPVPLGTASELHGVTASPDLVVAVADTGQGEIWNAWFRTIDPNDPDVPDFDLQWQVVRTSDEQLRACTHLNGTFVAVGDDREIFNERGVILTSFDGGFWIPRVPPGTPPLLGVGATGERSLEENTFVAVGRVGTLLTSTNGFTWTNRISSTTAQLHGAAGNKDIFVAVGVGGTIVTAYREPGFRILFADPVETTYGTPVRDLTNGYVRATASGRFTFDNPPGDTVLPAGTNAVNMTFWPDDTARFAPTNFTVQVLVAPAGLRVYAISECFAQGTPIPTNFPAYYSGFVNSETVADLDVSATFSTTADETSPSGSYSISTNRAAVDANYTITHENASLNISPGGCPDSLKIQPASADVTEGYLVKLAALGKYADGSEVDLTESVTWTFSESGGLSNTVVKGEFLAAARPECGNLGFGYVPCAPLQEIVTASFGTNQASARVTIFRDCLFRLAALLKDSAAGRPALAGPAPAPAPALTLENLRLFYSLRELMLQTEFGAYWERLYDQHSPELVAQVMTNATLRTNVFGLIQDFLPGVRAQMAGRGGEVFITPEQIDQLNGICDQFSTNGSTALAAAISIARRRYHGLEDFVFQNFDTWGRMLGLAEPVSILRSSVVKGQFQVEAKAVPGLNYTLMRSGDLTPDSWTPVAGVLTVTNGFRVTLTDPAPPARQSFYRLEANSE